MKIIKPGFEILDVMNGEAVLKKIEEIARVCYKSEDKICDGSAERMVRSLIRSGHEAMIEHYSFSVKFIVDRGISHEIVRHRLCSFAQESTRYVNYTKEKYGKEITVIKPPYLNRGTVGFYNWTRWCMIAEDAYFTLIEQGCTPEQARAVLPTSTKTELVVTTNLREWRNIFKLRCSKKAHPQIREVMLPLLDKLHNKIPVVFDDIWEMHKNEFAETGEIK